MAAVDENEAEVGSVLSFFGCSLMVVGFSIGILTMGILFGAAYLFLEAMP